MKSVALVLLSIFCSSCYEEPASASNNKEFKDKLEIEFVYEWRNLSRDVFPIVVNHTKRPVVIPTSKINSIVTLIREGDRVSALYVWEASVIAGGSLLISPSCEDGLTTLGPGESVKLKNFTLPEGVCKFEVVYSCFTTNKRHGVWSGKLEKAGEWPPKGPPPQ